MTNFVQSISNTQRKVSNRALPGMQPVGHPDWLTIDEAYSAQLAEKAELIVTHGTNVLTCMPEAKTAAIETLEEILVLLAARSDFEVRDQTVVRADGQTVAIDRDQPLMTLSKLIQEDLCILQKHGDAHHLTAALLCFPASWRLDEKIGRDIFAIHSPVLEYSKEIAQRVQRLFDGVKVGHPMWRANLLQYENDALFQPRSEKDPRIAPVKSAVCERSERQTLWRLPKTGAVVFSIHTSLAKL